MTQLISGVQELQKSFPAPFTRIDRIACTHVASTVMRVCWPSWTLLPHLQALGCAVAIHPVPRRMETIRPSPLVAQVRLSRTLSVQTVVNRRLPAFRTQIFLRARTIYYDALLVPVNKLLYLIKIGI